MVKDLLREIKKRSFQFLALTLITMLGVGFYVGIAVTGYDMRATGDAYMKSSMALDYRIIHTLGIDQAMVDEIQDLVGGSVVGSFDDDMYARSGSFDSILRVYDLNDVTKQDLTLVEGRLPENDLEAALDTLVMEHYGIQIGDVIKVSKTDVFGSAEVKVVGLVKSNLYMNLERGHSRLGVGSVSGFIYVRGIPFNMDEILFTNIRVMDASNDFETIIKEHEASLIENRFNRAVSKEVLKLEEGQITLNNEKAKAEVDFANADKQLADARIQLDDAKDQLEEGLDELAQRRVSGTLEERLEKAKDNFDTTISPLNEQLEMLKSLLDSGIDMGEQGTEIIGRLITYVEDRIAQATRDFNKGYAALDKGIKAYRQGEVEYERNVEALANNKVLAAKEFEAAQKKIDNGYQEIADADRGTMIMQTRKDVIIGYQEFYNDSNRIEGIGRVFPIIFFGVSILVTLSTITRLIDENRTEIGVYKALGYSSLRISMKFVLFSFFSWFIGAMMGLYLGFYFIPNIIYDAYRLMYATPEMVGGIVVSYALVPLFISFVTSVVITFYKSMKIASLRAADLMRPLAPSKGQRIFLERIDFFWKRLSFLYKVSFRNLFRNKTRFLMTLMGIGGTTGLLIVGFGIKHSIYSIIGMQFNDIYLYDGIVTYDAKDFDTQYFSEMNYLQIEAAKIDGIEISLYASEDLENIQTFVRLKPRKSDTLFEIDKDDVIITEKLAKVLGVGVGDDISVLVKDRTVTLNIDHITENYTGHAIYTSQSYMENVSRVKSKSNAAMFMTDIENHDVISEAVLQSDDVYSIQFLDDMTKTYVDMMKNFDIVIWVVLLAGIALEILVLSNLITMNMSERQKELATLKVLGFNKKELMTYVLRENIMLSFMASILGFAFGKALHYYVVTSAEIDMLMFNYELLIKYYVYAFLITMGVSIVINMLLTRRADKVNMSEALKSFDG